MKEQKEIETNTELEKILDKHNIDEKELDSILKQIAKPDKHEDYGNRHRLTLADKHVKFGVLSDLHIGHKNYRRDIMDHAAKYTKREGCEFIVIPGDILEGMSGRDGHIYELEHVGATNQLNAAQEELSKIKMPIYAITATASHDGWFSSKGDAGLEVGPELESRVKNFNFLGKDKADLIVDDKLNIRLTHPGGGTAYAISYKLQKYLNSLNSDDKPDLLFQGHYHKALKMFYQGVHAFEAGTLENQTVFMEKMGTPAHTGYWIVDAWYNKKGVDRVKSEFIPFYK